MCDICDKYEVCLQASGCQRAKEIQRVSLSSFNLLLSADFIKSQHYTHLLDLILLRVSDLVAKQFNIMPGVVIYAPVFQSG